jgi:excisionase family DNA binding protein
MSDADNSLGDSMLLTTRGVARVLAVSHAEVRVLIQRGSLPVVLIEGHERVPVDAVRAFVADLERRVQGPPSRGCPPAEENELLTTDQVSAMLGIPRATLYQWRHAGKGPPALRVGKHLRWWRRDVEQWLDSLTAPA